MRIDSYVVAAQKGTAQMAIITSSIGLIHRYHNQAALGGLNVLGGAVLDLVTAWRREEKREKSIIAIMEIIYSFPLTVPCPWSDDTRSLVRSSAPLES